MKEAIISINGVRFTAVYRLSPNPLHLRALHMIYGYCCYYYYCMLIRYAVVLAGPGNESRTQLRLKTPISNTKRERGP